MVEHVYVEILAASPRHGGSSDYTYDYRISARIRRTRGHEVPSYLMRNRPKRRCAVLPTERCSSIECVVDWYRCCSRLMMVRRDVAEAVVVVDDGGAASVHVVRLLITFTSCSATLASS